jgi:TetR/AcrR family transcriptional repressor of nem operon
VARPKEFDPGRALDRALRCFKENGFHGASLCTLTQAMGVGRASLYATYGDKRALFMAALADYARATIDYFVGRLDAAEDPLEEIRSMLADTAARCAQPEGRFGCFLVNSTSELAANDEEVRRFVASRFERLEDAYFRALVRARDQGRLSAHRDPRALARFLFATVVGLRVVGKARPDPRLLRDIADSAVACLGPEPSSMPTGRSKRSNAPAHE